MHWHLVIAFLVVSAVTFWAVYSQVCTACSIAHALLPPWELFNDYPRIQKAYKLFVYLVGYAAANWRSTLYQSLSTQNGQVPSKAAQTAPNGNGGQKP